MKRFRILILIAIAFASCGPQKTPDQAKTDSIIVKVDQNNTEAAGAVQNSAVSADTKPIELSEDDFAQKVFNFRTNGKWNYKGDKPCMVDFYAVWCRPCRMIAPFMEEFAKTYSGKMYMYKVNVDNARELSAFFSINSIPAVMFCPVKGEYKMVVGANPKDQYVSLIETFLNVK